MSQLKAMIPIPFASFEVASVFHWRVKHYLLVETRGDEVQIVQARDGDFDENRWYVVIHTGNLMGMIQDMKEKGFL